MLNPVVNVPFCLLDTRHFLGANFDIVPDMFLGDVDIRLANTPVRALLRRRLWQSSHQGQNVNRG